MNIFYLMLFNTIILLFPLIINLFYYSYSNTLEKEYNKSFFDFALISSCYLLLIFNKNNPKLDVLILLNIPLILAYIKKRNFIIIIISFIIVVICYKLNLNLLFFIIEYMIYFLLYILNKKIDILKVVCLIKLISIFIFNFDLSRLYVVLIFIMVTNLIISMYKKGEDIIKLHMTVKELQKEKQIRTSLFKITHEIKNPIAVCKSYLDMFDINNKEHQKYIDILKEEINQILLLLQDFLSMNKIKIQKELLDVNMLLEDIIKQFELVLKEKNIMFEHNITNDEIIIIGDYNRLNQVLINIIKNSVEALEGFENKKIKLSTNIDNNFNIIIEDNGPGISEDDMPKIKEPFYTTKKNGTGLGVSLSYEIIEAHKGTIEYISSNGCIVKISLPIYEIFI